jgi:hemerythrin-like domain-containing protein
MRSDQASDGVAAAVEGEQQRLIAWNQELLAAHERLRQALRLAQEAVGIGDVASARADLLLYCHGFCTALGGHHVSEDVALFPALSARHPELQKTIGVLEEDHRTIAGLVAQFEAALDAQTTTHGLALHLDGLAATMESHFRYEERRLLDTLATLDLDADPRTLLGPV